MTPDEILKLALDYTRAWQELRWDDLRALLADDVIFDSPTIGRVEGRDAHMDLYSSGRRFPDVRHVLPGPVAAAPDLAVIIYDVYLGLDPQRRFSVCDQVWVRDGKVVRVVGTVEAWVEAAT